MWNPAVAMHLLLKKCYPDTDKYVWVTVRNNKKVCPNPQLIKFVRGTLSVRESTCGSDLMGFLSEIWWTFSPLIKKQHAGASLNLLIRELHCLPCSSWDSSKGGGLRSMHVFKWLPSLCVCFCVRFSVSATLFFTNTGVDHWARRPWIESS